MVAKIAELAGGVDKKVWLAIAVVMLIVMVIGIIKKVAKTIIVIALVVMLATGGASFISDGMEKYGIAVDGTYLSIHNSNYDIDVDFRSIEKVEVKKISATEVSLDITSNQGVNSIKVSDTIWNLFKSVIKDKGIALIEK